jgi:hypothetical protein
MFERKILKVPAFLFVVASAFSHQAVAQSYPVNPVKIMQGFAPGGNADAIARLVGLLPQLGLHAPNPMVTRFCWQLAATQSQVLCTTTSPIAPYKISIW